MTPTATTEPLAPPDGPGWLILRVAMPRLARRLDRALAWVERYTPDRFLDAADELRGLGSSEGLALLAAVPPPLRAAALERIELDEADRTGLRKLADQLGDAEDANSAAAALVRMHPSVVEPALEVPGGDQRAVATWLDRGWQLYFQGAFREASQLSQRALSV